MPEDPTASRSQQPATEPDYRFTLANERTFLAWQRTSLGLLAASVAVLHFLPDGNGDAIAYTFGAGLGLLAVMSSAGGLLRWRRNDDAIRHDRPLPSPRLPVAVTVVLTGLGFVAVLSAIVLVG